MKITSALVAEHGFYSGMFDAIDRLLPGLTEAAEVRLLARLLLAMSERHREMENDLVFAALEHMLHHRAPARQRTPLQQIRVKDEEIVAGLEAVEAAPTLPEARRRLRQQLSALRAHLQAEEQTLYPLLEQTLHEESLETLGQAWLERYPARYAQPSPRPQPWLTSAS
jgi:hemerythrin-like domain-containing protein